LFIRQQTAVVNSIRTLPCRVRIIAPVGRRGVERLLEVVACFLRAVNGLLNR